MFGEAEPETPTNWIYGDSQILRIRFLSAEMPDIEKVSLNIDKPPA